MSDESVLIPIEAVDNFSDVFGKADAGLDDLSNAQKYNSDIQSEQEQQSKKTAFSFTELSSAYSIFTQVLRIGGDVVKETIGTTVELADSVRQMRDVTGQSAESSSRLIQVLDDYKITAEDAEKATKKLASEGYQFNIETLAKLSDEFLALNEGQERTQFLYDKFGKSGDKFAEIMLQGRDAILANNEAISEHLILTDKQLEQARELQKNQDEFNDNVLAAKTAIGNALIPVLNNWIDKEQRMNELIQSGMTYQQAATQWTEEYNLAKSLEADAEREAHGARLDGISSIEGMNEATEDLTVNLEEMSAANQEAFSLMGDFEGIADTYNEKVSELKDSEIDLLAQKQALIEQGYGAESEAILDINTKLAENLEAQNQAADAAEEAAKRRIAAMIENKLTADGLTDDELTALLELNKGWGLMSEEAVTAAQDVNAAVNQYLETGDLDTFSSSVDGITDALLSMPSEIEVKVNLNTTINGETATPDELYNLLSVEAQ